MPVIKNTQTVNDQDVTIYIAVDDAPVPEEENIYSDLRGDRAKRMARKAIKVADDVFGEGLELASNCAVRVVESIKKMDPEIRPDEYEIQLAIKLCGQAGAYIVNMGAESQLQVTMKWEKK